jgi:hypothetical protein
MPVNLLPDYPSQRIQSPEPSYNIGLILWQADLQTSSQRIPLSGHQIESVTAELHPQDTVDDVIHHEVKEVGTHM